MSRFESRLFLRAIPYHALQKRKHKTNKTLETYRNLFFLRIACLLGVFIILGLSPPNLGIIPFGVFP